MRYIGVDLHTTQLTVCYLKTAEDYQFKQYRIDEIERFLSDLSAADELAVEATGNSRSISQFSERTGARAGGDCQSARV